MATARGFVMHLSACLLKSWHRSHSLTAALASPSHFSHCCRLHQKLFVVRAHSAGQFNMTLCQSTRENLPMDVEPPAKLQRVEEVLKVKKLTEHAFLPKRGSAGAAGYDLASAYDCVVPARGKELVKTDLQISIPTGTYARVAPRSGLAWKNFIDTGAGVIDEDYRGNVGVLLFNHSDQDFNVKKGDRVAQLILERIATPAVVEVDDLEETNRGAGGFGSTGVSTAASS